MNDPIDRLLHEHRQIMTTIEDLRRAIAELRRSGEGGLADALPALDRVGHMMATDLLAHARREDEALFPALEAVFGEEGTPTRVMREEHREIHRSAELFRRTLRELEEVEHPAIVAGGERLRALAARPGSAAHVRQTAETVIELLDLHFAKEETVLFPMAREMLSREALERVAAAMAEIDQDV